MATNRTPMAAPETTVSGAVAVSRVERIADVVIEHTFNHDAGECMCGHPGDRRGLAEHVAQQIEAAL